MSSKRKSTEKGSKADPILFKQVLQLVEGSNKFGRDKIKGISTLCFKGGYASLFPETERDALKTKWDYLRRGSIENYHKCLVSNGITPSAATMKELEEARNNRCVR